MALDATLGGASANSYITVAEADGLMPTLVSKARSDLWLAIANAAKETHLQRAVRMLETYIDFDGSRVSAYQPLAWPRQWVYGPDRSESFSSDVLPAQIQEAQALMALNLSEDFDQASSGGSPVEQIQISTLRIKFDANRSARGAFLLPAEVIEKLRGFGEYAGSSGLARSIQMVRG